MPRKKKVVEEKVYGPFPTVVSLVSSVNESQEEYLRVGVPDEVLKETDKLLCTIEFSDGVSRINDFIDVSGFRANRMQELVSLIPRVTDVMNLHETLSRRYFVDPEQYGLVPVKVIRAGHSDIKWLIERSYLNTELSGMIHPAYWNQNYSWFPKDADPNDFGAMYLSPVGLTNHETWGLFQTGLSGALESVAWDDIEGFKRLVETCSGDSETALIIRSLQDGEEVAQNAKHHEYRRLTLSAREAFKSPKTHIRPNLTEDIIRAAAVEVIPSNGRRYWSYGVSVKYDLRPYAIFGWQSNKDDRLRPMNVALSYEFREEIEAEVFSRFVQLVQEKLNVRQLGFVLVDTETNTADRKSHMNGPKVWVVKDKDLFFAHHRVFGLENPNELPKEPF